MYVFLFITYHRYHFNTFKDNSNWNSGHQNHRKEWNQEKRTFSIIKQIAHSWEGGRTDCYPEKFIVNRISRGSNLLYHPLSYVLFVLLYWMFFSPVFILFMILMPWISIAVVFKCVKLWYRWCVINKITYIVCIC